MKLHNIRFRRFAENGLVKMMKNFFTRKRKHTSAVDEIVAIEDEETPPDATIPGLLDLLIFNLNKKTCDPKQT